MKLKCACQDFGTKTGSDLFQVPGPRPRRVPLSNNDCQKGLCSLSGVTCTQAGREWDSKRRRRNVELSADKKTGDTPRNATYILCRNGDAPENLCVNPSVDVCGRDTGRAKHGTDGRTVGSWRGRSKLPLRSDGGLPTGPKRHLPTPWRSSHTERVWGVGTGFRGARERQSPPRRCVRLVSVHKGTLLRPHPGRTTARARGWTDRTTTQAPSVRGEHVLLTRSRVSVPYRVSSLVTPGSHR